MNKQTFIAMQANIFCLPDKVQIGENASYSEFPRGGDITTATYLPKGWAE